ncbi:hypothetical protein MRX96_008105 [Rhipicephalus microplus]
MRTCSSPTPREAKERRRAVRTAFPFQLPLSKPGAVNGPSILPTEPVSEMVAEHTSQTPPWPFQVAKFEASGSSGPGST